MIFRWLIFFSLVASAEGAEVSGQVALRDSREASVRKGADFSGVVVSLTPAGGAPVTGGGQARMIQKKKTFLPHVLPVAVGSVVDFPNYDPIFHNAFSSYSGQVFDVGLYRPGSSRAVRFSRPGTVRVFCNIHPDMSAVIVVLKTPYFASTGKDGRFAFDAPPGAYELRVFHERASSGALDAMTRTVRVEAGGLALGTLSVSEAGYLPAPHLNKYGKAYGPPPDDGSVYPGVRK